MKERQSPYIDIKRGEETILSVPITPSSKVVYKLMNEHYIQLSFVLANPVELCIGDTITDELFGEFVMRESQMPKYEPATGGYKYEVKFEAWYMMWKNKLNMFTTILTDESETLYRKECQWYLTQNIKEQIYEILRNLIVLGYIERDDLIENVFDRYVSLHIDSVLNWQEAKTMSYSSTDIITSLNNIANTWECEWWITKRDGSIPAEREDFLGHFGKCEQGDSVDFALDTNVQSMNVSKNTNTFANKIYVYGSKDNIPLTYRKRVELLVNEIDRTNNLFYVNEGRLTQDMFSAMDETETLSFELRTKEDVQFSAESTYHGNFYSDSFVVQKRGLFNMDMKYATFSAFVRGHYNNHKGEKYHTYEWYADDDYDYENQLGWLREYQGEVRLATLQVELVDSKGQVVKDKNGEDVVFGSSERRDLWYFTGRVEYYNFDGVKKGERLQPTTDVHDLTSIHINARSYENVQLEPGEYKIRTQVSVYLDQPVLNNGGGVYVSFPFVKISSFTKIAQEGTMEVQYGRGSTGMVMINPLNILKDDRYENEEDFSIRKEYYALAFIDEANDIQPIPSDIELGTRLIVTSDNDFNVPTSLYNGSYDNPSSLSKIGDNRLQLPISGGTSEDGRWICKDGYIISADYADNEASDNVTEETVVFEKIYPDGKLQVKKVLSENIVIDETYDDDSQKKWNGLQYHVNIQQANGKPLDFNNKFVLRGKGELEIRFLIPNDVDNPSLPITLDNCKLAGMTFKCNYAESRHYTSIEEGRGDFAKDFTVIHNSDFGAMLPNDVLYPKVGDPCVLVNWNVKALGALGLISDAEYRLMQKGFEYARLKEENQFTFECIMMSDYPFSLIDAIALQDNGGTQLNDKNGIMLFAKNNYEAYALFQQGQKININHFALSGGKKESRIIGYEFKLDKPYDSPKYTVGETDAYSRLKKMEKEITKLS